MLSLGIDIGGTSTKLAMLHDGRVAWTGQSVFYSKPDQAGLIKAFQEAADGRVSKANHCGICVPGLLNDDRSIVTMSVNVPGLMNVPLIELVRSAFGDATPNVKVHNDAISCATDVVVSLRLKGRSLVLAMGTGVGSAVLDDLVPLLVDGGSSGHFGMMDVSVDGAVPIGPDGGAGSLEGYIGVPALRRDYGNDINAALAQLTPGDACLKALARAIRIGHAIYRPHNVVLAGGIGIRLRENLQVIRQLVDKQLTAAARSDWKLLCAITDFHAACGVARLASAVD